MFHKNTVILVCSERSTEWPCSSNRRGRESREVNFLHKIRTKFRLFRNVLPILNNLLENREMQLDDGRFLMAASKFDKLLEVIYVALKLISSTSKN